MSIKLLHGKANIWPEITALVSKGQKNLAAVAFVSKHARKLLPFGRGDTLVVDMSPERVKTGATNPTAVREFFEKGVSVFTCRGLHAKVFVLGKRIVVGSTNASTASSDYLDEAVLVTNEKAAVRAGEKFIEYLLGQANTLRVTELMLKKCQAQFRETGWHGGAAAEKTTESWSLKMMRTIAPKSVVVRTRSPYIEPTGWQAIQRIYLQDIDGTVVLRLHPGDTRDQALPLYDKLEVERLTRLISHDDRWEAWPNFHLGYRDANLRKTYTTTGKRLKTYLNFWKRPPQELKIDSARKPDEFGKLARDLMKYGLMRSSETTNFRDDIKNRPYVALRPGITLTFTWDTKEPTAKDVIAKVNEALGTWGESVVTVGTGRGKSLQTRSISA